MASSINASTTAGVVTTADTSGVLNIQTAGTTAIAISASQVVTLTNALAEASGGTGTTIGYNGFKNRIINGAMVIDQRNAGASVTPNNSFTLDRWYGGASQTSKYTVQQSSTVPVGFSSSLKVTSSSAYSVLASDYFTLEQYIEGFNCLDLAWGTANAKTVTLSFQVYSSLTGTFGGALYAGTGTLSYPFSYTISSANTWTSISITIAGPTTGTWTIDNSKCIAVAFALGIGSTYSGTAGSWQASILRSVTGATSVVGTNGATFYITGVQLEKGATATSFDYRDYGRELIMCQRYYWKSLGAGNESIGIAGYNIAGNAIWSQFGLPVTMRATPTVTVNGTWVASNTAQPTIRAASATNFLLQAVATGTGALATYPNTSDDFLDASSEL